MSSRSKGFPVSVQGACNHAHGWGLLALSKIPRAHLMHLRLLAPRRALTAFLRGCEEQLAPGLFLAAADTARAAATGCAADGVACAPLASRVSGASQGGASAAAVHAVREALDRGEQVTPLMPR